MTEGKWNGGSFQIERGTLRFGSLIAILTFIVGALIVMVDYKVNMQRDVREIRHSIIYLTFESFRRGDMAEWCGITEKSNSGFTCPNPYELPSYTARRSSRANNGGVLPSGSGAGR